MGDTLGDIGNPKAPKGTKPWVRAFTVQAQCQLQDVRKEIKLLKFCLKDLRDHAYYRILDNSSGHLFDTWKEFCEEPQPWGLGYTQEQADDIISSDPDSRGGGLVGDFGSPASRAKVAIVEAVPPLTPSEVMAVARQAKAERREDANLCHDINRVYDTNTNGPDRVAARIKRDHPDVAARVLAGEFPSIRAAGIAAGIVKQKASVMLGNPEQVARRICSHDAAFAAAVAANITKILSDAMAEETTS